MRRFFLLLSLWFFAAGVYGNEAPLSAKNPEVEAHMMQIASVLRCLVCQNQTIADSHADLALDLRRQITEMIIAGKSDEQIKAYMVARYGDFVLYQPPLKPSTVLLWSGPLILVLGGVWMLLKARRESALAVKPDEKALAEAKRALLGEDD